MERWQLQWVRRSCMLAMLGYPFAAWGTAPRPSVRATRGTPQIDGRLDDHVWRTAPRTDAFLQRSPEPGARATHRTTARILYDNEALYVAVEMQTDARPLARMGRRDQIPDGESVSVILDSRGEGNSAFEFSVNPAGVQADSINQGGEEELSWDAVWDAETSLSDHGWIAEFRIPWRVLRFDAERPTVRIQIDRDDFSQSERVALVPIEDEAVSEVARYARLTGIARVVPRRLFELRPFTLGRLRAAIDPNALDPTPVLSGSLGADLKLGITNDIVLDATVLPDFGQVEVDPARVNLTTFEQFFPERRPFFLEGSDLFVTPIQLVHTRRIGGLRELPQLDGRRSIELVSPTAMIYGAARVTGRVGRVSFGLIDAVTQAVDATVARSDLDERLQRPAASERIAPLTNWLIGRTRASIGPGSFLGGLFTNVLRIDRPADFAAGIDWSWRAPDGVHRVNAQFAATRSLRLPGDTRRCHGEQRDINEGTGIHVEAARAESTTFNWGLRLNHFSCGFDPNGLGYLRRSDLLSNSSYLRLRSPRPVGPFRLIELEVENEIGWNSAGWMVQHQFEGGVYLETMNRWAVFAGGLGQLPILDDRESRGGPGFQWSGAVGASGGIFTDRRAPLRASLTATARQFAAGRSTNATLRIHWTPFPALNFLSETRLELVTGVPRCYCPWDERTRSFDPIFGDQRAQVFDTSLRMQFAASRKLTFDLFSQLYYSNIRYTDLRELQTPTTFGPGTRQEPRGFDELNVTLNAVARFEYRRGSFITLVLLHRTQGGELAAKQGFFGSPARLIRDALPDTTVMAKFTYLLQ